MMRPQAAQQSLGHVAIIDVNPRRRNAQAGPEDRGAGCAPVYPETLRYRDARPSSGSTVVSSEFGARHVRVRGHSKVLCHLIGVLALTVDQILRLLN